MNGAVKPRNLAETPTSPCYKNYSGSADQIDERVEPTDRCARRRRHLDRIECAAEKGERRDDQRRINASCSKFFTIYQIITTTERAI